MYQCGVLNPDTIILDPNTLFPPAGMGQPRRLVVPRAPYADTGCGANEYIHGDWHGATGGRDAV